MLASLRLFSTKKSSKPQTSYLCPIEHKYVYNQDPPVSQCCLSGKFKKIHSNLRINNPAYPFNEIKKLHATMIENNVGIKKELDDQLLNKYLKKYLEDHDNAKGTWQMASIISTFLSFFVFLGFEFMEASTMGGLMFMNLGCWGRMWYHGMLYKKINLLLIGRSAD